MPAAFRCHHNSGGMRASQVVTSGSQNSLVEARHGSNGFDDVREALEVEQEQICEPDIL